MCWWRSRKKKNANLEGDKMTRKIIAVAVCFTAIITQAGAQELGIELNGGLQGTQYTLQNGQTKPLPAASLGLSYIFWLSNRLGLHTGVMGGLYRTQASLQDGAVFTSYQVDDAGSAFQYNVKTEGYKETQRFFAASIPLLLQYHTTGADKQWYIEAGGKVVVPFNSSVQISAQQLSLSGYYPDFNLNVSNLPQHGFGALKGWNGNATSVFKPAAALSAATGLIFRISPGTRLYTGLYLDYGLTDLKEKNGTMTLLTYSSTGINGTHANGVLAMPNASQVTLLSFGLQVRLSFGSVKAKPAAQSKTAQSQTVQPQTVPPTTTQPATVQPKTVQPAPVQPVPVQPAPVQPAPVQPKTIQQTTDQPKKVQSTTEQPTTKKEPLQPAISSISDSEIVVMQRPVLFGIIGESSIPEFAKLQLDKVAKMMKQYPDIRISVVGHICNSGTETEDVKVGAARANAVARYLRGKGIDRGRMGISSVGESDPVRSNNPAANYRNRRVVITVE
jgi:OOP family OmpA-OmpF porin